MRSIVGKALIAVALMGAAASRCDADAPRTAADPWQSLRFLMGTWEAKTQGGSANAAGGGAYTFELQLKNHVLARRSSSAECKGPADFDCEHADLLYVYLDPAATSYKAIYFDSEGHVIHYDIATPAPNKAVFLSEASRAGPQFRLIYSLDGALMRGKFQMRMPGNAEFSSYLEWTGAKK